MHSITLTGSSVIFKIFTNQLQLYLNYLHLATKYLVVQYTVIQNNINSLLKQLNYNITCTQINCNKHKSYIFIFLQLNKNSTAPQNVL